MRIAAFQFRSSKDLSENHETMVRAIERAAENGVRLLVFQECAACGYPPIETPSVLQIDYDALDVYLKSIQSLAAAHKMYIAVGTIRKEGTALFNSIQLIGPDGALSGHYDKRALWGWDLDHYQMGRELGIFEIDHIKVGFRICFEIRFPEYFRELLKSNVELCFVSFSDVLDHPSVERYELIKSHLVTRAVENVMTVVSVNSISQNQTAPTAVFDINGAMVRQAPVDQEYLLIYDYTPPEIGYGAEGRLKHSHMLLD